MLVIFTVNHRCGICLNTVETQPCYRKTKLPPKLKVCPSITDRELLLEMKNISKFLNILQNNLQRREQS